jgi:hypothetical protein
MLTRPKLIVPDQKGRKLGSRSSPELFLCCFVLRLGNLFLPFPLHRSNALGELLVKRATSSTFGDLGKPRMLAFGFCLNE